jgi:hypothetical protein
VTVDTNTNITAYTDSNTIVDASARVEIDRDTELSADNGQLNSS